MQSSVGLTANPPVDSPIAPLFHPAVPPAALLPNLSSGGSGRASGIAPHPFRPMAIFCSMLMLLLSSAHCSSFGSQNSLSSREESIFFSEPAHPAEAFRIFIAKGRYSVEQMQFHADIGRLADPHGDREQQEFFTKEQQKLEFKTIRIRATLQMELSSRSRGPQKIRYLPGEAPPIWQIGKYFINDLARFRFEFPRDRVPRPELLVRYLWLIEEAPGASRQKAVEYLRRQKAP